MSDEKRDDVKVPQRTMQDDMEAVKAAEDFYNAMGLAGFDQASVTKLAQARTAKKPWAGLDTRAKVALCKTFMLVQDVRKVRAADEGRKAADRAAQPQAGAQDVTEKLRLEAKNKGQEKPQDKAEEAAPEAE